MDETDVVLFQGNCSFCHWYKNFVLKRYQLGIVKFFPIESEVGLSIIKSKSLLIDPNKPDSLVVLTKTGEILYKWSACMYLGSKLGLLYKFLSFIGYLVPRIIGDYIYDFFGRHRRLWCRFVDCKISY